MHLSRLSALMNSVSIHVGSSVGVRSGQAVTPACLFSAARVAPRCAATAHRAAHTAAAAAPAPGARRAVAAYAVAAPPQTAADAEKLVLPQSAHGFTLLREEFVAEYGSRVAVYKHDKSGAECMSVSNNDENKTFGAVFRTPVDNASGIPHILEHSVLNGSEKYPVKEPFVELIKGSLHTFINAFTFPDRTCYPVASTNLQDFYNLADVYLDAVLHPKCLGDPHVFRQEGWHYELDAPDADMQYKGVVFNEMKGVYSQPDSVHMQQVQAGLFPDNNYAVDSGGDPQVIPQLSYDEFKAFHGRYYHPANARFWFYGDDPVDMRLAKLDEYLRDYDARTDIQSLVPEQPLYSEPRKTVGYYAAGEDTEGEEKKAFISVNWVLCEGDLDIETQVALTFLNYLLAGTSAAPMVKALNDSGLGESIVGGGVDDTLRQPIYSVGLKGVAADDVEKVEHLILETLHACRKSGFSESAVDAALNTIEFSLRENNTGRFPRGIAMMLRAMGAWVYDRDPYTALRWEAPLARFKERLAAGEDVFGDLLDRMLLNNAHRVTAVTLPDSRLAAQVEGKEKEQLRAAKEGMSAEQVDSVIRETKELKARQEAPDSPEALATIPSLKLADIPQAAVVIPSDVTALDDGATLLTHDLFTNNVLYAELALPLRRVPPRLLPLLPFFCDALTEMGTETESLAELTERIDRTTGGVSISPMVMDKRGTDEPVALLMVRGKAMGDKAAELFDLVRDILLTAKLDDQPRFKQMVLETKADMEAGVIGAGHSYAARRLSAQRTVAGWANEQMGGLEQLHHVRELAKRVDGEWDAIRADLEALRKCVLCKEGAYVNLTADDALLTRARGPLDTLLGALPAAADASVAAAEPWAATLDRCNEAILVPTQVNYVAKAANLYTDGGYKLHGSVYVINKHLGMTHIWDRVRVMGGAYGGGASFDSHSGLWKYSSYRDPNLLDTVQAYDDTVPFLRGLSLDRDALTRSVIGTIGELDSYQLPDAKGRTAFSRHVLGVSDEERQLRREEVLGTSEKDFHDFADALEAVSGPEGRVAAVTSKGALDTAHESKPGFFDKVSPVM